jgi:hypothetical protein
MNQANKLVRDALLKVLLGVAGSGASMDVLAKLPSSITEWEQQTWTEGWVRAPTKYALGIVVPFKDATRLVWLMRHGDSLLKGD